MPPLPKHHRGKHWLIALILTLILLVIGGLGVWAILGEQTRAMAGIKDDAANWAWLAQEAAESALEELWNEEAPVFTLEELQGEAPDSSALAERYENARSMIRDGNAGAARALLLELRAEPGLGSARSGAGLPLEALVLRALLDVSGSASERASMAQALRTSVLKRPSPLSSRLMEDLLPHLPEEVDHGDCLRRAQDSEEAMRLVETGRVEWTAQHPWTQWNSRFWCADFSRRGLVAVLPLDRIREVVEAALATLRTRLPSPLALRVTWSEREVYRSEERSRWTILADAAAGQLVTSAIAGPDHAAWIRRRTAWLAGILTLVMVLASTACWAMWRAFRRQEDLAVLQSEFIASVSHELRTPVASIGVLAERLESDHSMESGKASEYHTMIAREGRRMAALVDNVLDFSRIEQGRKNYEFEPADLPRLVRETARMLRPYAEERGLELEVEVTDWSEDQSPEVDALALRQAVINLIENGIKFSPPGGKVGVELLGGSPEHHGVRLSVSDEGPGIPGEEQHRIFERFYRADNGLRRKTSGAGIGLSLVKHIVEAHGGRVEVESEVGKGSCFTIIFDEAQGRRDR